jgi:hypothetical protein
MRVSLYISLNIKVMRAAGTNFSSIDFYNIGLYKIS